MSADLDALRARFPHLGFGVYAYEPDGPVTLEVHVSGGATHSTTRDTLAECIAFVFPEPDEPTDTQETEDEPDPFG